MARTPTNSDDSISQLLSARQFMPKDLDASTRRTSSSNSRSTTPQESGGTVESSAHDESANVAAPEDNPVPSRRSSLRRSGRPRMEQAENPALSENRRKQIRRAQRTYRLKKEASLQKTQARLAELEGKLDTIVKSFHDYYDASLAADLHVTHPTLFEQLNSLRNLVTPEAGEPDALTFRMPSARRGNMRVFAINTEMHDHSTDLPRKPESESNPSETYDIYRPLRMIGQVLERKNYTYAFQETEFSRSLQRYCLEHAFRLFTDPRSHPQEVYRVFRLVPCMKEREKMYPYFQRLITTTTREALEICSLPFYGIGGAGTHYPVKDALGNPVYPQNMRLPKRILGLLSKVKARGTTSIDEVQRHLELCGYGGEWEQGVNLESSTLFPAIALPQPCSSPVTVPQEALVDNQDVGRRFMAPSLDALPVTSATKNMSDGTANGDDIHGTPGASEAITSTKPALSTVLNVESFFTGLLRGVVILGRVPGFRRSDVMRAFKASLMVQGPS
ncbi:hypothetical protein BJX96DRAFT_169942 [Aspergillus floccosus]